MIVNLFYIKYQHVALQVNYRVFIYGIIENMLATKRWLINTMIVFNYLPNRLFTKVCCDINKL